MLEKVKPPLLGGNEPAGMIPVGSRRNKPTYAKNGTTPSHERGSRRPPLRGGAAALTAEMPAAVKLWLLTSGRKHTYPRRFAGRSLDKVACRSRPARPPSPPPPSFPTSSPPPCAPARKRRGGRCSCRHRSR